VDGLPQTEARIFSVTVENVLPLWPQWEPLLVRALRGSDTHTPMDVRRLVLGEMSHLWIQWSDRIEAFVITEFVNYPRGRWLRLWLAASAPDAELNGGAFEDMLVQWRDANDCRGFELLGRLGWMRRFPHAKLEGVIMRTVT